MVSVIVPAHNEERVIGRCLSTMLSETHNGDLEVIVVCNGCTDKTAEIVRDFGDPVTVIETVQKSKTVALNLGDAAARSFPRFYVDADVEVSWTSIQSTARVLDRGPWLAASPKIEIDVTDRPWLVRAFCRIWTMLPYFDRSRIGSGIYAISEAGRMRFETFPDIVSDDGFARLIFSPDERTCLPDCSFRTTPPRTLRSIVRIKTRSHKGNLELKHRFPELQANQGKRWAHTILELFIHPSLWPSAFVYAYVMVISHVSARLKLKRGDMLWERDETSRD